MSRQRQVETKIMKLEGKQSSLAELKYAVYMCKRLLNIRVKQRGFHVTWANPEPRCSESVVTRWT
jgi:hypothetical protein